MEYVPHWEQLAEALKRVTAGVSEDQAKLDISRAIADKRIRVRLTVVVKNVQGLGSPWKRLSDALTRVTAIGIIDEAQAKRKICRAIADRRTKIRLRVAPGKGHLAGTVRSGDEVEIPTALHPDDFDWQHSRPLKPWRIARQSNSALTFFRVPDGEASRRAGCGKSARPVRSTGSWRIDWIEVWISSDEITECFEGANVKVPSHLTPGSFDWENSRPLNPWPVRPHGGRLNEWQSPLLPALFIELHSVEVLAWIRTTYGSEGTAPSDNTHEKSTSGQESRAIKALASYLESNKQASHTDAAQWCKINGYSLGKRAFERVWPEARVKAGQPRNAKPGRKPKSVPAESSR
jgi:hypothetical protein